MNKYFKYFFKDEIFPNHFDWAILLLRTTSSFYMIYYHGIGKIMSDARTWEWLGRAALSPLGIQSSYIFFGFIAALSESILPFLVIIGFFTRIACVFIIFTMLFAGLYHISNGESPESAFIYMIIYITTFILGSGKFSLDYFLTNKKNK